MKPELIGPRIKQWRKHLGLTQAKFAELSRVHIGVLKKYERGVNVPGGEVLGAFSSTGVNINWLLTGEGNMEALQASSEGVNVPEDLNTLQSHFDDLFELILQIDEDKREEAIDKMLAQVKEAARINDLERLVQKLNKEQP